MADPSLQMPPSLAVDATAFKFSLALSSKIYEMRFTWDNRANEDAGAWRWDLFTANGSDVLLGQKLVLTVDMFDGFHHLENVPPGALKVTRRDGGEADPGLLDLGGAAVLAYVV